MGGELSIVRLETLDIPDVRLTRRGYAIRDDVVCRHSCRETDECTGRPA